MPHPTGPTNPLLKQLVEELKAQGHREKSKFLLELARLLSRPERIRAEVNLSRIERHSGKGETVIVPGKVLSSGALTKSITIAAAFFSGKAADKIAKAGGKIISISDLVKENPKGTGVKILV